MFPAKDGAGGVSKWVLLAGMVMAFTACKGSQQVGPAAAPSASSAVASASAGGMQRASASASATASASAKPAEPAKAPRKYASQGLSVEPSCHAGSVSWSPSAQRFVVPACEALVAVDLGANRSARVLPSDEDRRDDGLAWSADGRHLTSGRGHLFDTKTFSMRMSPASFDERHPNSQMPFYPRSHFSPDGTVFVVTNAVSLMWFFDPDSVKLKRVTPQFAGMEGRTESMDCLWNPASTLLLSLMDGGSVRLMGRNGMVLKLLGEWAGARAAWHPNSSSFVLDAPGEMLRLYSANGSFRKLPAGKEEVEQRSSPVRFSGDGKHFLAREHLRRADGTVVRALPGVTQLEFSPDGGSVLWYDGKHLMLEPVQTPAKPLRSVPDNSLPNFRWLPDGKRILYQDKERVELWDATTRTLAFPAILSNDGGAWESSVSPDGVWLATSDGELMFIRLRDGKRFFVRVEVEKGNASVLVYNTERAFLGSLDMAERILRRDGKPLSRAELTLLLRPDLLAN